MHATPLRLISAAFALAIAATAPASAQHLREGIAIGDDWLIWRHDAATLRLVAAPHAIAVDQAEPDALLGLQPGDQIDSTNGQPMHTPEQLLAALRAANGHAVTLGGERAGSRRNIVLSARDYASLPPPAPSSPPAPPSPVQVR